MMESGMAGSLRLVAACAAALLLSCSLAGCSGATAEQGQRASGAAGDSPTTGAESVLDGASDHGMVVDFDDGGITLRPDEGNDEVAIVSLEDTGAERRIEYADGCAFSIVTGNASTGSCSESAATKDAVKKDSTVFVWTGADGLAEKVAVFRNE